MSEYRRTIELEHDKYHRVLLGPIPEIDGRPAPTWHEQSKPSSYPFPTLSAATRFAQGHSKNGRSVMIEFPDGRRWDGAKWGA